MTGVEDGWIKVDKKVWQEYQQLKNQGVFMELQKHTVDDTPPTGTDLLMLIDIGAMVVWTVGVWDEEKGWHCSYDDFGYFVIEWYELPEINDI